MQVSSIPQNLRISTLFLKNGSITASGAISIAAGGSNQNVIVTPSGTGRFDVVGEANQIVARIGATSQHLSIGTYTPNSAGATLGYAGTQYVGLNAFFGVLIGRTYVGSNLTPPADGMAIEGKVLLGTTTDSANGKIQLATHTTSAGGIGFGADTYIHRAAANQLVTNANIVPNTGTAYNLGGSSSPWAVTYTGSVISGGNNLVVAATGIGATMTLRTTTGGGVTTDALTLDSSQNAMFAGAVTLSAGSVQIPAGNTFRWATRGFLSAASDGVLTLNNSAGTDFGRLQFGGTSASFPALKRSGAGLQFRLADDSAFAPMECGIGVVSATTASTSTTTGALVVGSNVGLSGNAGGPAFFGGDVFTTGEKFVVGAASSVFTNSLGNPQILASSDLYASAGALAHNDTSGNHGFVFVGKSRGSKASPTIVANGDTIGEVSFMAYDGAAYRTSAFIQAQIDGVPAAANLPTRLVWSVSPPDSATPAEAMRLKSTGNLLLGTTTDNGVDRLQVNGSASAAQLIARNAAANAYVDADGGDGANSGYRIWSSSALKWHIVSAGHSAANRFSIGTSTGLTTFTERLGVSHSTGEVSIPSTTASTSTTTGSATFGGGIGVAGNAYVGGNAIATSGMFSRGSGASIATGAAPGFHREAENGVHTDVISAGEGARLAMIQGFQNGGNTIEWSFGAFPTGGSFNRFAKFHGQTTGLTTGGLEVFNTTASTSTTTGALVVGSNVGLSGNAGGTSYFGGTISNAGGYIVKTNIQTGTTYTVTSSDYYVVGNNGSGLTVTLIAASSNNGRVFKIKNKGAANLTVDATGLGQIFTTSAVNTVTLATGDMITLTSDGAIWNVGD